MPKFATVTRDGKTYRRRTLTKAQRKARAERFRQTMAAKANGGSVADDPAPKRRGRPPKANGAGGHARDAPSVEGSARLKLNTEDAIAYLKAGEAWLQEAWGTTIKRLDPAHRALINAKAALLDS